MPLASALVPLWNRDAEWRRRIAMIEGAQSFVYLSTFYLEHDVYGLAMLDALESAQSRGVMVSLLIDSFGQGLGGVLMSAEHRAELERRYDLIRSCGGVVQFYTPRRMAQRLLGGGHHIKIQLSDAGEAIYGSSNITRSSFAGWNEYSVALRGPVILQLIDTLEALGVRVDSLHRQKLANRSQSEATDIDLDYRFFDPNHHSGFLGPLAWRGQNSVTEWMIELLDNARELVSITSFYFKPTRRLMKAVLRAAHRGVRIEVFHSHRNALSSTDLAWIAAAAGFGKLLRAGVAIYENRHGEHSKLLLIDDTLAVFGSYNFEDAAHDRLAEAMMASADVRAVQPVREIFAELRRHPDNARVERHWFRDLPVALRLRIIRYARFKWWM
jgi:cardiolipin synthase